MANATTVRVEPNTAELLKEIVDKRKAEFNPVKNNQSVTAEAIKNLHKKEFRKWVNYIYAINAD